MDFFNNLYPEQDGALQTSNMRFLLSIPEGEGKLLTKRIIALLISAVVLVITFLTVVAAYLSNEQPRQLHEHMKPISEVIGCTQDVVFTALSDGGSGLVEISSGNFAIPGGYVLDDVKFEVLLHFQEHENLLNGYSYVTRLKIAPKEAAKVLNEVLGEYYNESVTFEGGREVSLEAKALADLLSGTEPIIFRDSADVTPRKESGTAVAEYIEHLQAADYWEGRLREYLIKTANYYRDIEVTYTPDTQILELELSYQVEADRG